MDEMLLRTMRARIRSAAKLSPALATALLFGTACADPSEEDNNPWNIEENNTSDSGGQTDSGTPDMSGPADQGGEPDMEEGSCDAPLLTQDYIAQENIGLETPPATYLVCGVPLEGESCEDIAVGDYSDQFFNKPSSFANQNHQVTGNVDFCTDWVVTQVLAACMPQGDGPGECCYSMEMSLQMTCDVGRPFTIEGLARVPEIAEREGWSCQLSPSLTELSREQRQELAQMWADAGCGEHASVASFSRFLMELMSLGAPHDLIQATSRAITDEIRHARLSFGLASAYAGHPLGPAHVSIDGALDRSGDVAHILRDAILEGCIGETISALRAQRQAEICQDPVVREVLEGIAEDEAQHAELAWSFVAWLLGERPDLAPVARATFSTLTTTSPTLWAHGTDAREASLRPHGRLSHGEDHLWTLRSISEVLQPCAAELLAA